jgi:hypothetical protein
LWRRSSWLGVAAVCLLLAGVVGLRLLSHLDADPTADFEPARNSARIDPSANGRLRKAFDERNLGRILLACRSAWDMRFNRLLHPQGIAWRPDQLDFHVAEGSDRWRHYWCRQGGVGRGDGRDRPASIGGRLPLALDLFLYEHAEVLAESRLRTVEVLGDGNGGAAYRLAWKDGLRSGPRRNLPAASFDSLLVDDQPAATLGATLDGEDGMPTPP